MKRFSLFLLFTIASFFAVHAQRTFSISPLFHKNMVIQAAHPLRVHGTGTAGDTIKMHLQFNDTFKEQLAVVDNKGTWFIDISPLPSNVQCDFVFYTNFKKIAFNNIKTGDVWLLIGGSNTVHQLGKTDSYEAIKKSGDSLMFHYLQIPKGSALTPQVFPEKAEWKKQTAQNLPLTPSIAYHFGSTLYQHIDTPIGIINCGFGGSLIESWMRPIDLGMSVEQLAAQNRLTSEAHKKNILQQFKNAFSYPVKVDQLDEDRRLFSSQDYNDTDWETTKIPETFDKKGLQDFDGVVWFRKNIFIPEGVKTDTISMGFVDDSDEVFINGQFVGGIEDGYGIRRIYSIPENLIKPGLNSIAVRVRDIGGGGGMYGDNELYYLSGASFSIELSGEWKFRVEAIETDVKMNAIRRPGMLYNQMVHPLTNFPVKGIIWYQGEVEAVNNTDHTLYKKQLATLIKGYRSAFNNEDLPFILVQLPSYSNASMIDSTSWSNFKYCQEAVAKKAPNTAIISITDLINAKNKADIHLSEHTFTGQRLAKTALHQYYQHSKGALCPEIKGYKKEAGAIILSFDLATSLKVDDPYGYVRGFEIAEADRPFVKTAAEIINNKQVLLRLKGKKPVSVRYCGQPNSTDGNLFSSEDMPVLPFVIKVE